MQEPNPNSKAKRTARVLVLATIAIMAAILTWHNTLRPQASEPVPSGDLVELVPGEAVGDLYRRMVRVPDINTPCPGPLGVALLETEILPPDGWACLRLVNRSEDPGVWRIDMNGISTGYVVFHIVRKTSEQQVLTHLPETAISDRETGTRRLASAPFAVAGGEMIEIWATFPNPGNFQVTTPTLRPELDFDAEMVADAHTYGGLMGASGLLAAFFIAFAALLQTRPARVYALYFGLLLLLIAVQTGYLASVLSLPLGLATGPWTLLIGIIIALVHLRFVAAFVFEALPGHYFALVGRRLHRIALVLLGLSILIMLAVAGVAILTLLDVLTSVDPNVATQILSITVQLSSSAVSGGFALLGALHAIWAGRVLIGERAPGAGLFALGAVMLLGASIMVALGPVLSPVIDIQIAFSVMLFADALVFAAAIVLQTFGLRSQRDNAMEAELAASQEQLRLSETLLAAHQDLDQARRLAETHRTRLAHTSHDLRQPLMSLQLALTEADTAPSALRERLSSGLDYLREVLSESMTDGRPDTAVSGTGTDGSAEPVPLSLLMTNAVRMFGDEARAKGLTLRAVDSELSVRADPVALIRMLSNLVSNAVKYTDKGAVLIGPRRKNGSIAIEVRDSGPGMSAEEVVAIRESYTRGAQAHAADGEGIGLASVEALTRENGLSLTIRSAPGRGTCMAIEGLAAVDEQEEQDAGAAVQALST
ncbi:Virulence sensor protein BvgS precursor [Roseisalinus antarcticus]|uniref:histidine kinase n=2 Tax=Roseisalinus antarcticus TaxID=254357 RepID=A0A1Y5TWN1_9RHOB|nr:Virulence sensor protein BvgS precursor [Roseisalinus antarcticus]